MIRITKSFVKISLNEWNAMKRNPIFSDVVEYLEDIAGLESTKSTKGKDIYNRKQFGKNNGNIDNFERK
jgi:hypothetical protein